MIYFSYQGIGLVVFDDIIYRVGIDENWHGIDHQTLMRCNHNLNPARRVAWGSENGGRRFLGCPIEV